jgi:hypothetical protein
MNNNILPKIIIINTAAETETLSNISDSLL